MSRVTRVSKGFLKSLKLQFKRPLGWGAYHSLDNMDSSTHGLIHVWRSDAFRQPLRKSRNSSIIYYQLTFKCSPTKRGTWINLSCSKIQRQNFSSWITTLPKFASKDWASMAINLSWLGSTWHRMHSCILNTSWATKSKKISYHAFSLHPKAVNLKVKTLYSRISGE